MVAGARQRWLAYCVMSRELSRARSDVPARDSRQQAGPPVAGPPTVSSRLRLKSNGFMAIEPLDTDLFSLQAQGRQGAQHTTKVPATKRFARHLWFGEHTNNL
jgi:hypothetical protein